MYRRIADRQRAAILQAARDARDRAPVDVRTYDAVDLATDTGNHWYSMGAMPDRTARAAYRLIMGALAGR